MTALDPAEVPEATVGGRAPQQSATARLREDLRVVLPSWVAARALVAVAWFLAAAVADHEVTGGRTIHQASGLLGWDGGFYRTIAEAGYGALPAEALRFFPL